jgi:DNA-binding CsgD family transcriptional regulator
MMLDRLAERAALDQLLSAARARQSSTLVVRGEAGIGKTVLLDYAIESASGFQVVRAVGVESEMELAYAALQQLCAPMLDHVDHLPGPQRDALGVAFGLRAGDSPDRLLVGLAALSLMSEVAEERPLLCVIDDAQWLDHASAAAIGFVARRLLAEPVVVLVGTRGPIDEFARLPEIDVRGLRDRDARELLASVIRGPLDAQVRERIVAETRGNPLALLELPRALTPAELAGGFGVPDTPGLSGRIEGGFRRRIEELPPGTQRLLLIAAAEPTGAPTLLWRAAERLGLAPDAAEPAETAGLLAIGERVNFRHPLVRSAVYRAASPEQRRVVHRALADATDPQSDPDRRVWHRAQATITPDEDVAIELERSADRAQARGGYAAAAVFLERSAALTVDPGNRARRALEAANSKYQAGGFDAALRLLATVESGPIDEFQRAQADRLRGQIAFSSSRGSAAPPLLLKAAQRLAPLDPRMARDTYLDALSAAIFAGRLASAGGSALDVAEAARAAPLPPQPARAPDLLLDGLAALITDGHLVGAPILRHAIEAFRGTDLSVGEGIRWLWLACHAAGLMWDYESWDVLSARQAIYSRDAGSLIGLVIAYSTRAGLHLFAGEFATAAALVVEVQSVMQETASTIAPYGAVTLAVLRGREAEAFELIEVATKDVEARGEGEGLTFALWARAVLCNSLGRYGEALAAARQASEDSHVQWFSTWALAELIEAAARSRIPETANRALQRLSERTRASATDWALGVEARSRALLSDDHVAEGLYRRSIDLFARTPLRVELGRSLLVYGEWLRRQRRRRDGREQLGRAHEIFDSIGADAFAERARTELRATGGYAHKRTVDTGELLSAQEGMVARLASGGASNSEIAAQLFISPATVAYHLRKVFTKLGISSRTQLVGIFTAEDDKDGSALTGRAHGSGGE